MAAGAQVLKRPVYFGSFLVTSQVFYSTAYSFALVNLKPLLPGHVLVCPNRVVPRLKDLSTDEVTDLFLTVQKVSKVTEKIYKADSLNIAMQDGIAAGQSVPHVHIHIIPRHFQDLPQEDQIYTMLESQDGDLGRNYLEAQHPAVTENGARPKFPTVHPDAERKPRSEETMAEEAKWLAGCMGEGEEGKGRL
ncbi:HIT-like domain-containing protein [Tuber borchii]|uniref:Bis(5'-adenosyl)-triphosphatase n=1 Tax=Tuber borchii TaxID=42251 RepID=A0A2T6Z9W3_TUBBO|nr:HIT-like domain-containing protein [Tuber borchii]